MDRIATLENELNDRFQLLGNEDPISQRLMGKLEKLREQYEGEHQGLGEGKKNGQVELTAE